MNLRQLMIDSQRIAHDHGFITKLHNFSEKIALIHSELSEALEEYRAGHPVSEVYYGENGKPEGVGVELADAIIRICDLAQSLDIPLVFAIEEKQAFNLTRPFKHGKQF